MQELDIELIKRKAKSGVLVLTSRTIILQIITFVFTFLLTVFLRPDIFGIFFVVSAAISFLSYFSDIGLAAALVQKKEEISPDDLKTTFTIQLVLVSFIVLIALLLSSAIAGFYNLDNAGLWLFRAFVVSFFLSSLKTIPSIILERKLEFNKFVIPQIVETTLFYVSVVIFAWLGWGVTSFTIGVVVRSVSGLITIYIIVPWFPKLGFNKASAKKLLSFGIPFQLNSLLALIKDDLLTIYLGKALGFTAVGYIGWAKKWSEMPLRLIMDNINKVSFPAFSRLQHDKQYLAKTAEKAIFFVILFTLPAVICGMVLINTLINVIPKYLKWEPALFSFYLFSITVIFSSVSSLLTNMIQALGRVKIILKLMIMWTILTWLLIPVFIKWYDFNGVALASLLISTTVVFTVIIAYRLISFNFLRAVKLPLIIGLFTGVMMYFTGIIYPFINIYRIILTLFVGLITYLGLILLFVRKEIKSIIS